VGARPGKFETANGGTLLLDEVGEMPLALQPKLLRALQEREFDRLGSNHPVHVDIRVIATSNRPLEAAVAEGRFRADLFYRLNVIPISLPPLRDRAGDIGELAEYFAGLYAVPGTHAVLSRALVARLEERAWPGNVRELGNFVRRAVALSRGGEIGVEALDHGQSRQGKMLPRLQRSPEWKPEWKPGLSLGEMERQLFAMTLESTGGNRARAAELLGVSLRTVRNKVREFGLPPRNDYRNDIANGDLQNQDLRGNDLRGNDLRNDDLRNNNNKEQSCP
jgi:transcriptional regulator with GAF, ATPase, and Fis domain